ncbi:MAG: leucine-rich repeat domain-containing protein, partial [Treponema sp.]|nr:leucine-rich repeat domain-containing protein [Treponema sp.]
MYKTVLAVFLSFIGVCAYSQTVVFGTEVNPEGTGITITGFKGDAKEIVIPRTIDGLPVTAIGEFAFDSRGLTKLTLPEGLESI